jgi:dsDNA-specific endonuclease/ATPase MutS2
VNGEGPPPPDSDDPVLIPIEDAFDLHAFRPSETAAVVEDYLAEAAARGFPEVRLIHGRGIGVQREIVRGVLARSPHVLSFADAPPERGGWGATVARLRAPAPPSGST